MAWPSLPLPAWLGSEATWFLVLNVIVAAIAVLSSRPARPSASPRSGGVTRRASSVLLQRLRSFSIFSYPSACLDMDPPTLVKDAAAHAAAQATEEEPVPPPAMPMPSPSPSPRALTSQTTAPAAEEEEDLGAMSMEDAYALVLASRRPPAPEPEREDEEARRADVDAEEKDNLRQQRLNSIFNYTQMLKQRALGAGRRLPDARPHQL